LVGHVSTLGKSLEAPETARRSICMHTRVNNHPAPSGIFKYEAPQGFIVELAQRNRKR